MASSRELRIASWNVEHNGRGRSGDEDKRQLAHSIVKAFEPHVFFRQELTRAWDNGKADLYAEGTRLGLMPFMTRPPEGRSRNPVGIMIDPVLFDIVAEYQYDLPWKPICRLRVRIKGCRRPIELASAHLCHFDPDIRATEARWLTTLADCGRSVIVGGDMNSYPHTDLESETLPDWDTIPDRVHYEHRTIERDGKRVSDTRPDEILTGSGVFTDLGLYASTILDQSGALLPTASLTRTDQGPAQRIDRICATPDWAQTLTGYEVVATDDVKEVTDHGLVLARFDLDAVCRMHDPIR